jgi:peptidoglycan/LPS O-acetylase OafA/YrhL
MRSSTGEHWIALDHIRALAAFCVFTWHFTHGSHGGPVPIAGAPAIFPLAILDEGHVGVSLFMTLSGYLFAKLLDGKSIDYPMFFWNRFLRLAPLLIMVVIASDVGRALNGEGMNPWPYLHELILGFLIPYPPLPNGVWSIVVEIHFYLVLPLLMKASRSTQAALPIFLATIILLRWIFYLNGGAIQNLVYWSIGGHIDQFLLGILAFRYRPAMRRKHAAAAGIALAFALFYYALDLAGGYYHLADDRLRASVWVILPTVEGLAFATLIAYYDSSYSPRAHGVSGLIAKAGAYSYSIYLLHFFFVLGASKFIGRHVMDISNFYIACLWSALCFAAMVPVAMLSFRYLEEPFLRMRRRYTVADPPTGIRPEALRASP